MKNMHEIASNVAIIGGLLTSAGSIADAVQNKALFKEMAERASVTEALQAKFSVEQECTGSVFSNPPTVACFDIVPGAIEEEEKKILEQYRKNLREEQDKIPMDPRGYGDLVGFVAGAALAAGGGALRRKIGMQEVNKPLTQEEKRVAKIEQLLTEERSYDAYGEIYESRDMRSYPNIFAVLVRLHGVDPRSFYADETLDTLIAQDEQNEKEMTKGDG